MANPNIKIKRTAVPGKKPTVEQLPIGELALNFYDADLFVQRYRPGIGSDVISIGAGASVSNVMYVTSDGDDGNAGRKLGDAKATIESAIASASPGTVIKISSGDYTENNPLRLPEQVSLIGDSLREVTIRPQNANEDLIHVTAGNYLSEMSFRGSVNSGQAAVSFDPNNIVNVTQSPYVSNCTNFITNSIGLKIDGNHTAGDFKSMVVDSYTQYNQGGIGASITNGGYGQIVSFFTIATDVGIFCGSGGACDVTNSNSSFGNFGLVADGVGDIQSAGFTTATAEAGSNSFAISGLFNRPYDGQVLYIDDLYKEVLKINVGSGGTGYTKAPTVTIDSPSESWGIDASGIAEIDSSGQVSSITLASSGRGFSSVPSVTISGPEVGINTATATVEVIPKYYLVESATEVSGESTTHTPTNATYFPSTGNLNLTVANHQFSVGDGIKIADGAITFTCATDANATEHPYPRAKDPASNKWLTITSVTTNTFRVNVGTSSDTSSHTFVSAVTNGVTRRPVGISTVTITESLPYPVSIGMTAPIFEQSRILASSHSFEYIGSGTDISTALPQNGGVTIPANEVDSRNGGLVIYTSTDQAGNFKIGDGVVIDQARGTITGDAYTKSLFANITPYILALGG